MFMPCSEGHERIYFDKWPRGIDGIERPCPLCKAHREINESWKEIREKDARILELETRLAAPVVVSVINHELYESLKALVTNINDLVNASRGVDGLHLNGDVAEWDSLLPGGDYQEWLFSIKRAEEIVSIAEREAKKEKGKVEKSVQ